ncbi:MAG: hypothetical protein IKN57_00260 [Parasporobacterium sp.]|nr:hypothetical protein [Parasporobacterium sp.]MBR3641915.1 hypothetical protein [Parasporobacterium sp.]
MYTSVIKQNQKNAGKTTLIYLIASIICAVFGAVYESFSHGVYSFFMIYAFAFPLLCGVLPFLLLTLAGGKDRSRNLSEGDPESVRRNENYSWQKSDERRRLLREFYPGAAERNLYHCGIIALTTGSLLTGVLEIYGTTNYLLSIYWLAGAALLIAAIAVFCLSSLRRKARRNLCSSKQSQGEFGGYPGNK